MTPPRLTRWLLRLLLRGEVREAIEGDLAEEQAAEAARRGPRAGRRLYRRLALRSVVDRLRAPAPIDTSAAPRARTRTGLSRELRPAARRLARDPGFSIGVAAALALGIGACTAIFSVVDALLVQPLPYRDAERVVFALGRDTARQRLTFGVEAADFTAFQEASRSFETLAAYRAWSAALGGEEWPERVQAYRTTPQALALLGVEPRLGRLISSDDARPGAAPVAVLSHALWSRRFGADARILERSVRLDGVAHRVVGVMPDGFEFPVFNFTGELWTPLEIDAAGAAAAHGRSPSVVMVGRLASGIEPAEAQAELGALAAQLSERYPEAHRHLGIRVLPMQELLAEPIRAPLLALQVAVVLVLLVACADVGGLMLARGASRRHELAVRATLGAGPARLAAPLVAEAALLAAAGGALGIALAGIGLDALVASLPDLVLRTVPQMQRLGLDATTLAIALVVTALAAVACGLAPALRAARGAPLSGLRHGGRGSAAVASRRARQLLLAGQSAVALVLLLSAGLAMRGVSSLLRHDPGFDAGQVLTAQLALGDLPERERVERLEAVRARVLTLPGVASAGLVDILPFSTADSWSSYALERDNGQRPGEPPSAPLRCASPGYLETLRVPILEGRGLAASDDAGAPPVALISAELARLDFAGRSPLGERIRIGGGARPWRTIVGVVGDVRHESLVEAFRPHLYVPFAQRPPKNASVALRAERELGPLAGELRRAVAEVAPDQPLFALAPLADLVDQSLVAQSVTARLMALFGLAALLLTGMGLYALVAEGVSQRRREIGVRVALGAGRRRVLGEVLRDGLTPVAIGVGLGLIGAFAAARVLGGLLVGLSPLDPVAWGGVTALVLAAALLGCAVPTRRALRLDPAAVLREE